MLAGTLSGLSGFQDFSIDVKWRPVKADPGSGKFSLFLVGGFSTPLTNYVIDFLPMSIGLDQQISWVWAIVHYQIGKFSYSRIRRLCLEKQCETDRTAYFTTTQHNTNEVRCPDLAVFNGSLGYHYKYLVAEAMIDNNTTLGGFIMRRNDMPL
jgi:hypothetical protein